MKVQECMINDVIQISPEESIAVAARRMREHSVGCLVVTVAGAVKGIITDRDLLGCIEQDHISHQCGVATHMSRPVIVLNPEEDHMMAAKVMREKRIKRLPIAIKGKLLGIVSLSDLAAFAGAESERLHYSLGFLSSLIEVQGAQRKAASVKLPAEKGVPKAATMGTLAGVGRAA